MGIVGVIAEQCVAAIIDGIMASQRKLKAEITIQFTNAASGHTCERTESGTLEKCLHTRAHRNTLQNSPGAEATQVSVGG